MSNATDTMALYRRRKCYAKSKYKAWYRKRYNREPDQVLVMKWEQRYRKKKEQARNELGLSTFEGRLQIMMAEYGLTCSALAEELYKCDSSVERWIKGTQKPNFYDLIQLSDLFEVSIDWLIKGE